MGLAVAGAANFVDAGGVSLDQPGASPWRTIVDFDFTAYGAGPISFGTDGLHTLGGVHFYKENSANDSTAMFVTGTGLVIEPAATKDYNFLGVFQDADGQRQCPLLRVPLAQFPGLARLSWQSRLRVWAEMLPQSLSFNGYCRTFVALDAPSAAGPNPPSGAMISAFVGGGDWGNALSNALGTYSYYWSPAGTNGEGSYHNSQETRQLTADFDASVPPVLMLECDRPDGIESFLYSGAGPGLPSYYALQAEESTFQAAAAKAYRRGLPLDVRNMGIALGACSANPPPGPSYIKRFRLDVLL